MYSVIFFLLTNSFEVLVTGLASANSWPTSNKKYIPPTEDTFFEPVVDLVLEKKPLKWEGCMLKSFLK